MRKAKVDKLIKRFSADARRDGEAAGRKRLLEEMTFTMSAPDGAFVLGTPPRDQFVRVALTPRGRTVNFDEFIKRPPWDSALNARFVNFAAKRMSWTSAEGHTVCWYDWEFKGVSF